MLSILVNVVFPQMFTYVFFLSENEFLFNSIPMHICYRTYMNAYVRYTFEYRNMSHRSEIDLCSFVCIKMRQI